MEYTIEYMYFQYVAEQTIVFIKRTIEYTIVFT